MNQKKLLTLVASIFVIVSLFVVYSKYKDEKLALEQEKAKIAAEQAELDRLKNELETFINSHEGELTKETLEGAAELFKVKIEDEYKVELESELFVKEAIAEEQLEQIKFLNNSNELKLQIEITYYSLPKMAVLIDDVGGTTSVIKYFDEINRPLNFAILPYLARSKESNEILKSKGYSTMLHMPMEGSNKNLNERTKGLVFTWMKDSRVINNLGDALANIGPVDGFNNHMGSAFTSNEKKMQTVINYAKENNLYYVDSNTSRKNKGYGLAKETGVQTTLCRHFLDNSKNIEDIKKEIKKAVEITKSNQQALFIGHYHKNMAIALKESIEFIESEGVKLVYVNEVLE